MSDRAKTLLIKYGASFAFVAVVLALFLYRVNWATDGWDVILHLICDGLTISGTLLLGVGALIWCSNEGALDGISYAIRSSIHMFIPTGKSKHIRYGDYVEERRSKRVKGYGFLLISGGITMGLALLVLVVYSFA